MTLAAEASGLTITLIALIGSGGIAGAIVAILKLGSDKNSAAVSQAQGAMETMQGLNEDLVIDRNYWRDQAKERRERIYQLEDELDKCKRYIADHEHLWGHES